MRTALILIGTALALALFSPVIAHGIFHASNSISLDGAFYTWFLALPAAADHIVWPETNLSSYTLSVAVYFCQYLAVFAVAVPVMQGGRFAIAFVRGPRHRSGLAR